MKTIQFEQEDRKHRDIFLKLPFQIYADYPQWVPPLEIDIKRVFNRKKNPYYQHSEAAFFIVFDHDNAPCGRIAILNHHKYNEFNKKKTAFFYLFECKNDQSVANELFTAGFKWARSRGLDRIKGPRGFTVFDGLGLLVKGFQYRPAFGLPYNPPYYEDLIIMSGFIPETDIVSGYLDEKFNMPDKLLDISELLKKRRGLSVTSFKNRKEIRKIVPTVKELYNSSLGRGEDNIPISDEEVKSLADQLLWFADPRLIKFVLNDNHPIGFLFAYPDISAALQRTKGKIFPFGWISLLLELRRTKWININGAGIIESYRGLGGPALLFTEMYKSLIETRYRYADLVQIGTENLNMQRELRDLGIDFYKLHRVYSQNL